MLHFRRMIFCFRFGVEQKTKNADEDSSHSQKWNFYLHNGNEMKIGYLVRIESAKVKSSKLNYENEIKPYENVYVLFSSLVLCAFVLLNEDIYFFWKSIQLHFWSSH